MSRFELHSSENLKVAEQFKVLGEELNNSSKQLGCQIKGLSESNGLMDAKIINQILKLQHQIQKEQDNLFELRQVLVDTENLCETAEKNYPLKIDQMANAQLPKSKSIGSAISGLVISGLEPLNHSDSTYAGTKLNYWGAEGSAQVDHKVDWKKGDVYTSMSGNVNIYGMQGETRIKQGLLEAGVMATVGSIAASGNIKASLMENGRLNPRFSGNVLAEAKGVSVKSDMRYGNKDINGYLNTETVVGYAQASANGSIGIDGVKAGASVGAALVRGETKTGFEVFGIKVELATEAELLGAGASAQFELSDQSIEFGGKLSFIAGLGLRMKIYR
ncbi:MAG: hypothetical protein RR335_09180 [Eubacterium sp.]